MLKTIKPPDKPNNLIFTEDFRHIIDDSKYYSNN